MHTKENLCPTRFLSFLFQPRNACLSCAWKTTNGSDYSRNCHRHLFILSKKKKKFKWRGTVVYYFIRSFHRIFKNKWKLACSGIKAWWIGTNIHYLKIFVHTRELWCIHIIRPTRNWKIIKPTKVLFVRSVCTRSFLLLHPVISDCLFLLLGLYLTP